MASQAPLAVVVTIVLLTVAVHATTTRTVPLVSTTTIVCGHCLNNIPCPLPNGVCHACQPGWSHTQDPRCLTPCSNGTYGDNCTSSCGRCLNGEVCNKVNGSCSSCDPGFHFDLDVKCKTVCSNKSYGDNCTSVCGHCLNGTACDKVSGSCASCDPGYNFTADVKCTIACFNGTWGQNCSNQCSSNCNYPVSCDKANGSCSCKTGFKPPTCESACDNGTWGQSCVSYCSPNCLNGGVTVPCDKATGECLCQKGYQIPRCKSVCPLNTYGQNCSQTCGHCVQNETCDHKLGNCSRCLYNREPPLCQNCLPGYWGPTCWQLCGQCGGDGRCDEGSGQCPSVTCQDGWTAKNCTLKCSPGSYGPNCSLTCGHCRDGSVCRHDTGVCDKDCQDGYEGVLCVKTRESLTGVIVGAALGAAAIVSITIIVIFLINYCCRLRNVHNKQQPKTLGKDLDTAMGRGPADGSTADEAVGSVYQNSGYEKDGPPAKTLAGNNSHGTGQQHYTHLDYNRVTSKHLYEPHRVSQGTEPPVPQSPSQDQLYQNEAVSGTTNLTFASGGGGGGGGGGAKFPHPKRNIKGSGEAESRKGKKSQGEVTPGVQEPAVVYGNLDHARSAKGAAGKTLECSPIYGNA